MKDKNGFTLIELLVVISIIGVLALMGLRLYLGQLDKAKNAMVKANVGTVQTLIQANMSDTDYDNADPAQRVTDALGDIPNAAGCHNPYTGGTSEITVIKKYGISLENGEDTDLGKVAVASPEKNEFKIQGLNQDGKLLGTELQAKK